MTLNSHPTLAQSILSQAQRRVNQTVSQGLASAIQSLRSLSGRSSGPDQSGQAKQPAQAGDTQTVRGDHTFDVKYRSHLTYSQKMALCQQSELDTHDTNQLESLLLALGFRTYSDNQCNRALIDGIVAYSQKFQYPSDYIPTHALLEDVRKRAIGDQPAVSNSQGEQVPAKWQLTGQAPNLTPPDAVKADGWAIEAMKPVASLNKGGAPLGAQQLESMLRGHTWIARLVNNDITDRTHVYAIYFDEQGFKYTLDNTIGYNSLKYSIEGNKYCYNGITRRVCQTVRSLGEGGMYVSQNQDGNDVYLITKVVSGDYYNIKGGTLAYFKDNGAALHDLNQKAAQAMRYTADAIKADIQRRQDCAAAGGYMTGDTCWVHRY